MRRKDRERDAEFARNILANCLYATLSTVNADGTPYGVPVSPVLVGDVVYFHCAPAGQKLDNIARQPRVCLSCASDVRTIPEEFTTQYASAVVFGAANCVEDANERRMALVKLCEKYTPKHMHLVDAMIARSFHRTAVYKIVIERITGKQKKLSHPQA